MTAPCELSAIELASGILLGSEPHAPSYGEHTPSDGPRDALEQVVLEGLHRPPCVVSFSGGRDSSLVLAVATAVARRHGLPNPVPMTLRFPAAESDESAWQEQIVRHLGLTDWERITLTDELDAVGPIASDVLRRHGVLWPFNVHFHVPILRRATGGTVLTGIGGDEILLPSRWLRVNQVVARRVRPAAKDVARLAIAYGPRALRAAHARRSIEVPLRWLTSAARRALRDGIARDVADEPIGWDRWLEHSWWPSRSRVVGARSLTTLAHDAAVTVVNPLEDRQFLRSLGHALGRLGYPGRDAAMDALAADLLPRDVLHRRSKATFDGAFWTDHARAAAAWDGGGFNPAVVDAAALRAEWSLPRPDLHSMLLLQALQVARVGGPIASAAEAP